MELIAVSKAGEYLEIHPSTLAAHQAAGWAQCDKQAAPAEPATAEPATAAELKSILTDAGVKFDARWSRDKLAALWAAFQRWGMDAEAWNNLSADDIADRMAHVGAD